MDPRTDGELMQAAQNGCAFAFNLLLTRRRQELYDLALRRVGDHAAAEEVVQEACTAAFRSLHTYNPRYRVRTWLWTITANQAKALLRKRSKNREDATNEVVDRPSTAPGPKETAERKELAARTAALLTRLSPAQAEAIRLRFYGDLKYREIAEAMQCSLLTAKNRVKWGHLRLASLMQEPSDTTGELDQRADSNARNAMGKRP